MNKLRYARYTHVRLIQIQSTTNVEKKNGTALFVLCKNVLNFAFLTFQPQKTAKQPSLRAKHGETYTTETTTDYTDDTDDFCLG